MNDLFNTNVTSRIVYLEKYLYLAMNVSDMYS